MELLAATNNRHKLAELVTMLAKRGIAVLSADDVGGLADVVEDALTFRGNAIKKALAAAQATGHVSLADDSGLEVFSIGGEPGVLSARYAGTHGDDEANIGKLLARLGDSEERQARFVCAIAVALPNGQAEAVEGYVYGTITDAPLGDRGFGYDPVFLPDGYDQTFGEMDPAEKDTISHRAEALREASECGMIEAAMEERSSREWFVRAEAVIPGGVNSPVRAFGSVGGDPLYVRSGKGARFESVDGEQFLDFCCSWGPLILGHAHPAVVAAVQRAAESGMTFGVNTPGEVELAELITRLAPEMEMVRLVSSGTEATMTALRLAKGVTGRQKILKFDGCYHGHSDQLLVSAGSGLLTGGIASSAGVSGGDVFVAPYNDLEAVREVVAAEGNELAAIIVEPVAGNMGFVSPDASFLGGLRDLCDECGALLIFDEVITGFRFGPTTYGHLRGIAADLTCLGKVVGGGMPIGAIGGPAQWMTRLAPLGNVYQAGTLSGNPVAVAAGLTTLRILSEESPYQRMAELGDQLRTSVNALFAEAGLSAHCAGMGSVFTLFFGPGPVQDLDGAKACDTDRYAACFRAMRAGGIYLPPSQFELSFLSSAHHEADVEALTTRLAHWLEQL